MMMEESARSKFGLRERKKKPGAYAEIEMLHIRENADLEEELDIPRLSTGYECLVCSGSGEAYTEKRTASGTRQIFSTYQECKDHMEAEHRYVPVDERIDFVEFVYLTEQYDIEHGLRAREQRREKKERLLKQGLAVAIADPTERPEEAIKPKVVNKPISERRTADASSSPKIKVPKRTKKSITSARARALLLPTGVTQISSIRHPDNKAEDPKVIQGSICPCCRALVPGPMLSSILSHQLLICPKKGRFMCDLCQILFPTNKAKADHLVRVHFQQDGDNDDGKNNGRVVGRGKKRSANGTERVRRNSISSSDPKAGTRSGYSANAQFRCIQPAYFVKAKAEGPQATVKIVTGTEITSENILSLISKVPEQPTLEKPILSPIPPDPIMNPILDVKKTEEIVLADSRIDSLLSHMRESEIVPSEKVEDSVYKVCVEQISSEGSAPASPAKQRELAEDTLSLLFNKASTSGVQAEEASVKGSSPESKPKRDWTAYFDRHSRLAPLGCFCAEIQSVDALVDNLTHGQLVERNRKIRERVLRKVEGAGAVFSRLKPRTPIFTVLEGEEGEERWLGSYPGPGAQVELISVPEYGTRKSRDVLVKTGSKSTLAALKRKAQRMRSAQGPDRGRKRRRRSSSSTDSSLSSLEDFDVGGESLWGRKRKGVQKFVMDNESRKRRNGEVGRKRNRKRPLTAQDKKQLARHRLSANLPLIMLPLAEDVFREEYPDLFPSDWIGFMRRERAQKLLIQQQQRRKSVQEPRRKRKRSEDEVPIRRRWKKPLTKLHLELINRYLPRQKRRSFVEISQAERMLCEIHPVEAVKHWRRNSQILLEEEEITISNPYSSDSDSSSSLSDSERLDAGMRTEVVGLLTEMLDYVETAEECAADFKLLSL